MAESAPALLGIVLTLLLHASVLLGAVWLLERLGALRHPRAAELAWRAALFGALLSALGGAAWRSLPRDTRPAVAAVTTLPVAMPRSEARLAASLPMAPRRVRRAPDSETAPSPPLPAARALTAARVPPLPLAPRAIELALMLWAGSTLAWLALSGARLLQLQRLRRRLRRGDPATADQIAHAAPLAAALRLATPPTLRLHDGFASPVALPGGVVLLPRWSTRLPLTQSRALLAHEFAHLARHDPAWRLAQQFVLAPLALLPLAWLAVRRLEALAELQADACAAHLLGDGRPLAECLATCLAQRAAPAARAPRYAIAMTDHPGAVVDRVERLLDEDTMRTDPPSPLRTRLALALGIVFALALPAIAVTAFADEQRQRSSISVHIDDDGRQEVEVSLRRGDYALEAELEGQIVFADDESDVVSMAADALLELSETRDGVARSIAFQPDGAGVSRDYRVDGKAQAFDATGRAWLAQALPELFRSTGIDAEARAKRFLARGGADALLDEIALVTTDHGRGRYLGLLFTLARLDAAQQGRALTLAESIDSDHELRQALAQALTSQTLAREQQHALLALAARLGSDFERAELLIQAVATFTRDAAALALWRGLVADMGSDFEQRRVLEALLERSDDPHGAARLAFEIAAGIGSDFERRQVLEAGVARAGDDAWLRHAFLAAAAGIGSDFELRQALEAMLRQGPLDAPLALATLEVVDEIDSDHECKEALLALAQVMPLEPAVLGRYRASARRLGSFQRGQVEQALDRLVAVH